MSAAKRSRGGLGRLIRFGVLAACVVGGWYLYRSYAGSVANGAPSSAKVIVPRGATVREVAGALADAGAIRAPRFFRTYASIGGRDRLIKPGTYQFQVDAGWKNSLDALVSGKGIAHSVTIPEGYDLRQIGPLLAKHSAFRRIQLTPRSQIPRGSILSICRSDHWKVICIRRRIRLQMERLPAKR